MSARPVDQAVAFPRRAARHVLADVSSRVRFMASQTWLSVLAIAQAVPLVASDSTGPTAANVTAQADADYLMFLFDFFDWQSEASQVRGSSREVCLENLSLLLSSIGPVRAAELNATAGALSLLPTAGALVGAPAKELWVLFKLMPVAGLFSMVLSLGGSIVPSDIREYSSTNFTYDGMMATAKPSSTVGTASGQEKPRSVEQSDEERFAKSVAKRAEQDTMSRKRTRIIVGILIQMVWIAVIVGTCWFVQAGGVIVWWCKSTWWMFFWYGNVVLSSLLENFAGVPFTEQWTIRTSRAPPLNISQYATTIMKCDPEPDDPPSSRLSPAFSNMQQSVTLLHSPGSSVDNMHPSLDFRTPFTTHKSLARSRVDDIERSSSSDMEDGSSQHDAGHEADQDGTSVLEKLKQGVNKVGGAEYKPGEPPIRDRVPFYVIISVGETTKAHALLRVFSKILSVGVFAAGTVFFASTTLISISVALTALCLIIGAGVFGRVVAMWMANEMIQEAPILHRVVKDKKEAETYVREVLKQRGLMFEIMGHIVINGKCVGRYSSWLRWSTYFGLLAPPFNLNSIVAR